MSKKAKQLKSMSRRAILIRIALAVLIVAALIIVAPELYDQLKKPVEETRGEVDMSQTTLEHLQVYKSAAGELSLNAPESTDGCTTVEYVENPEITTILMLGIDNDDSTLVSGYRSGGQSDFIMLIVIDHKQKVIRRLHINRDTMTSVQVLSVLGKPAGTRRWQIALAHNFGKDPQENNRYTKEAVENLLPLDVKIDLCASLYLDGIAVFNDAIGGVTVYVEDDFSAITDQLPMGQEVLLEGKLAETFTRARHEVGNRINTERMHRQLVYMEAALDKVWEKCNQDTEFASNLLTQLTDSDYLVSDITPGRLVNELNRAIKYEIRDIEYIADDGGKVGARNFWEVTPDEDWLVSWVLDTYYIEQR